MRLSAIADEVTALSQSLSQGYTNRSVELVVFTGNIPGNPNNGKPTVNQNDVDMEEDWCIHEITSEWRDIDAPDTGTLEFRVSGADNGAYAYLLQEGASPDSLSQLIDLLGELELRIVGGKIAEYCFDQGIWVKYSRPVKQKVRK
jgi:hypothetical protein